ncbi:UDP-N-acetylglucosamine 2-epimerase (non-hydrolyzing) [Candidatus Woesearchaeota archaeon]|nr:UDP-N-acetylglucosamine 2-epimerase (non-hydrolyzing) [Candidatus Woesearchaeota archaeon]
MKILSVVGTRPNFIKIAALISEFKKHNISNILVHTGQHYDKKMSKLFFDDLGLPKPDINLGIRSGEYSEQINKVIAKLDEVIAGENPNLVVVVGDVNSTLAGALVAKQRRIKVAHVEAGLRSFDLDMPEEINRMLTDAISDFLFTTEESGNRNLLNEGITKDKIFFVGNVMIDTLLKHREKASKSKILQNLRLKKKQYCVLTLHRPSNVDNKKDFENIISMLEEIQQKIKVIFSVHPRTRKNIQAFNLNQKIKSMKNLILTEPLGYLDFLWLMSNSNFVLTDSGGIQEETTVLGVPCITLRSNTERPVTIKQGSNLLVSTNKEKVIQKAMQITDGKIKINKKIPELWDGKAAERIVKTLLQN